MVKYTAFLNRVDNGRDSFQLFVGVFDTFLVWYLPVLPSGAHAIANMTSLRAIDGDLATTHVNPSHSILANQY